MPSVGTENNIGGMFSSIGSVFKGQEEDTTTNVEKVAEKPNTDLVSEKKMDDIKAEVKKESAK